LHISLPQSHRIFYNSIFGGGRYSQNSWDPRRDEFLDWEVAKVKFSLEKIYHDFWIKLQEFYELFQDKMVNQQNVELTLQEWGGLLSPKVLHPSISS
jgi:hypothetical protein